MKVLIIGSKSIHVSTFIYNIHKSGMQIYLISEDVCSFDNVLKENIVNFRKLNPISLFLNYSKLKKYILEFKPDVIHIHQLNRLAYFSSRIAKKIKTPIVSTAWGSDVLIIPFKNIFYKYLTKKIIQNSFLVTADARILINSMQKIENDKKKYILLHYGIETIKSKEKEQIIFTNRLHKKLYRNNKIIEYFDAFSKNNLTWKLIIAGNGGETDDLKNLVKIKNLEDKVEFVGWLNQEENNNWYSKSTIYISIPNSDGTSISVLEAMSAGCIPILSDITVSHELIIDNENGIIESEGVNPINKAILLDRNKLVAINKKLVESIASKKKCTANFINIYIEATSKINL